VKFLLEIAIHISTFRILGVVVKISFIFYTYFWLKLHQTIAIKLGAMLVKLQ